VTSDQPAAPAPVHASGNGAAPSLDQTFCEDSLFSLRNAVAAHGAALGLSTLRVADLVLLAHELASNAVRHGGATPSTPGRLRLWAIAEPPAVVCEVSDAGPGLADPDLAGTEPVAVTAGNGRGLWIARKVADEIDIVAGPSGTRITATFLVAG
jgi:anti-sigma regulatory factor (Ser/Thr protein kinase)